MFQPIHSKLWVLTAGSSQISFERKTNLIFVEFYQSLPRVVGSYTLSNLCQRLYAMNLGKIRLLKGNLI